RGGTELVPADVDELVSADVDELVCCSPTTPAITSGLSSVRVEPQTELKIKSNLRCKVKLRGIGEGKASLLSAVVPPSRVRETTLNMLAPMSAPLVGFAKIVKLWPMVPA